MAKKEVYNIDLNEEAPRRSSSSNKKKTSSSSGKSSSGKNGKKQTRSQKRRKRRRILFAIELVILIIALLALYAWLKIDRIDWETTTEDIHVNDLSTETEETMSDYTNIALFGVDNRSTGNTDSGNSDSIMICSINNTTKEVKIVSVYRDTLLDYNGKGSYKKANYAYNHGGPEEAIEMLNRNLDLNIQSYVTVDFYALAEAVDALGGITLTITEDEAYYMNSYNGGYIADTAKYTDGPTTSVSVGTQTVNGTQAVAYCRIRYTSGGDFGRAARQRTVVQAIIDEAKQASLSEINNLINDVFDDVGTSLSLSQALSMAASLMDYSLVDTAGFPFDMKTGSYGSASVVYPTTLESNVVQLHEFLFDATDVEVSSEVQRISEDIISISGLTEEDAVDYGY